MMAVSSISNGHVVAYILVPVVPHKAVVEVSRIETIGEIGCCESPMAEQKH